MDRIILRTYANSSHFDHTVHGITWQSVSSLVTVWNGARARARPILGKRHGILRAQKNGRALAPFQTVTEARYRLLKFLP